MPLCVCFTYFLHVCVQLLCTYTAFAYVCVWILCPLCVFFVHIRFISCASSASFAYIYRFCARWAALRMYTPYLLRCLMRTTLRDTIYQVLWSEFFVQTLVICWQSRGSNIEGSAELLSVRAAHFYLTVLTIQSQGFRWVLFTRKLVVIIALSWRSDIKGSVKFFVRRATHDSPSGLTLEVYRSSW